MERREYLNLLDQLRKSYSKESLGFLQRFYAIHLVNEMLSSESVAREEWNAMMKKELADLYSSECAQSIDSKLGGMLHDPNNMPMMTVALLESYFPEFLDGNVSFTTEQRQIAVKLISSSKNYQKSSSSLKGEVLSSLIGKDKVHYGVEVPIIGNLSHGKVISLKRPKEQTR